MRKYILSRLIQLVPILIGISFMSFAMMQLAADDAVDIMYQQSGAVSEAVKAAKRAELGLDQPFLIQYANWIGGVVTGDMGRSFISGKLVFDSFMEKLPATVELMLISLLLTLLVSVPAGIYAALHQNKFADYIVRYSSFLGNSMPNFFVALLLIYFFALKLQLLPIMGSEADWRSVILPAVTLAISMGAKYTRQIRAIVLEELGKDYVIGARMRGISEYKVIFGGVMRVAMITIITLLAISCGSLLGGTAIVETIFMWDGVGKMAVDAILMRDYPIIQAYVIWMAVIYVMINLAADLAYRYLDPRISLKEGA